MDTVDVPTGGEDAPESHPSSRRFRPSGARVRRLHSSHTYRFVLILILILFLFIMASPDAPWSRSVGVLLLSGTLVAAIWTSGFGWSHPRMVGLGAVGVAIAVLTLTFGGDRTVGVIWLLGVVFAAATVAVIAVGVADQGEVNGQSVVGAVCIYLLLGMLFAFAYGGAAELGSGFFFAQGTDGTPSIRLYFSYVTMATVGYGDYSAAGDLGRTLAVLEGLLGQLYLVTVVTMLVSRLRLRPPPDGSG